ncbi:MAG TPA: M23 family metallopeptidase [Acidimicrobiales bacterium]|nr:M23 family metallopeptidase [Acidimicrobiales bacterium]
MLSHPSRAVAGALLAVTAAVVVAVPAVARTGDPGTTTTSSTSSTSSTTTSTTFPGWGPTSSTSSTSTTSTTAKPTRGSSTTTTSSTSSTTTTTSTTTPPGQVPPEVQAQIDAYPRTPAGSTEELVRVLAPLDEAKRPVAFGRFPVAGLARWSHDWMYPRHTPEFHTHEGTDVFARRGTKVIAPAAGTVRVNEGSIGGLAVRVTQTDGTYWYLAHLDEATVEDGDEVVPGDVIGTVGDSGNAKGGAPHVHVEVHPGGGEPLDPKPILDQYYAEALAAAPDVMRYLGQWVRPIKLFPLPDDAVVVDVTPDSPETATE